MNDMHDIGHIENDMVDWKSVTLVSGLAFAAIQWIVFPFIGRKYIYKSIGKIPAQHLLKFEMKLLSTLCVLVVAGPATYIFFTNPELYKEFRYIHSTVGIQYVCSIYLGYLFSDSITLVYSRKHNSELGPWTIHHVLGVVSCVIGLNASVYTFGIIIMLWTEFCTIFTNNIFILPLVGLERFTMINSLLIIILWIILRTIIAWPLHLIIQIYRWNEYVEHKRPSWEIFFSMFLPFSFGILNAYWLYKIFRGFFKLLRKRREENSRNTPYRRKLY